MADAKRIEQVIAVASDMKQGLEDLLNAFRQLIPIIDQEHAAAEVSDLAALEQITDRKVQLAEAISIKVASLQNLVETVRRLHGELVGPQELTAVVNFGEAVDWLHEIHQALQSQGFGAQVLGHVTAKLSSLLEAFREAKAAAQPKIEMNAYLVRKLLENHRQTYQFWQEVARESNGTYTASGVQRPRESTSVLRIKA